MLLRIVYRAWLFAVAGCPLILLEGATAVAQSNNASNSGQCSLIIQGSNNVVNGVPCTPASVSGGTVLRTKYAASDLVDSVNTGLLHPLVIRDDQGSIQRLTILFEYPAKQKDGSFQPQADLVMVYGYQTTSTGRYDPPPGTFPSFSGTWNPGDQVKIELNVPTSFFEETSGWNVRFCIGTRQRCLFSPNLLTGARVL
jgi:hypothetical protein